MSSCTQELFRRNRRHLRRARDVPPEGPMEVKTECLDHTVATPPQMGSERSAAIDAGDSGAQLTTRTGHVVVRPHHLKDFVT